MAKAKTEPKAGAGLLEEMGRTLPPLVELRGIAPLPELPEGETLFPPLAEGETPELRAVLNEIMGRLVILHILRDPLSALPHVLRHAILVLRDGHAGRLGAFPAVHPTEHEMFAAPFMAMLGKGVKADKVARVAVRWYSDNVEAIPAELAAGQHWWVSTTRNPPKAGLFS
jgi:hypothetical protein